MLCKRLNKAYSYISLIQLIKPLFCTFHMSAKLQSIRNNGWLKLSITHKKIIWCCDNKQKFKIKIQNALIETCVRNQYCRKSRGIVGYNYIPELWVEYRGKGIPKCFYEMSPHTVVWWSAEILPFILFGQSFSSPGDL